VSYPKVYKCLNCGLVAVGLLPGESAFDCKNSIMSLKFNECGRRDPPTWHRFRYSVIETLKYLKNNAKSV
jgi:hypothetical protein